MRQRRWLVTGVTGQLGAHVYRSLTARAGADCEVLGTSTSAPTVPGATCRLDLTDQRALARMLDSFRPTHIAHLAAQASPRAVAQDPCGARAINVDATRQLADYAGRSDAWLGFPSSDWVFDGSAAERLSEVHEVAPSTTYGRLKVEAERIVLRVPLGLVLRLPLLCGLHAGRSRDTTWESMRNTLVAGGTVRGITDEYRTPVSFTDAASWLIALGDLCTNGLLHGAGRRVMTPFDVILALADSVGASARVDPCTRSDLDVGLERPRWVALDGARLRTVLPHLEPVDIGADTFAPVAAASASRRLMDAS